MPNFNDGMLDKWAEEAMDDLGEKGWRDIDPNSMMLIIHATQRSRDKKLQRQITKPMWWLLGTVGTGVVWWIISGITGIN